MMAELEEFVFQAEHKGETFRAYLNIAIGEKSEGVKQLSDYITKTQT